ncbi:MAG TPA: hypothetical protein VFX31_03400 [Ktedonobacterales bacterium]|nr:hypothetical protein [Ktedonobacterales bacterium]
MDVARLDDIRLTVVDEAGTVSFVAHASAAVALTAACSHNPTTLRDLLDASERYDRGLRATVLRGLAVFDEHNLPDDLSHIHSQLGALPPRQTPVFRVLDTVTREASLRPVRTGVVLFNLPARRIVQIENTYEPLARAGEVNFHNGKFLSIRLLPYELPPTWSIVP